MSETTLEQAIADSDAVFFGSTREAVAQAAVRIVRRFLADNTETMARAGVAEWYEHTLPDDQEMGKAFLRAAHSAVGLCEETP